MKLSKDKINFIGIGAQKSGTSWIDACMREHPQICMGKNSLGKDEKEVHFFNEHHQKGAAYYESFFKHCPPSSIVGEYTPMYLFDPEVPERIKKLYPDVKLIVCLRNPIERAYSQYLAGRRMWGGETLMEAIEQAPEILERGFYAKQLKRYLRLFPREKIYVAIYEDIKKDPLYFIQNIYSFLGVDSSFVPNTLEKRRNASTEVHVKIKLFERIRQMIRRITSKMPRLKYILKKLKARRIERTLQKLNTGTVEMKEKPDMYADARMFLRKAYESDIKELESLLQLDLSHWK